MERRQLLTLSMHSDSPGQRFRIHTWAPYLSDHGIDNTEVSFATPELSRVLPLKGRVASKVWQTVRSMASYPRRVPSVSRFDGVLIVLEAIPIGPPLWEQWIAKRRRIPLAFDFDDPIFLPRTSHPAAQYLRDPNKWKALCGMATVTTCVNEMVADYVRPYCRRVEVVPNAIDLDRYPRWTGRDRQGPLVLGYSGSHSTMFQLSEIEAALAEVARTSPFRLRLIGGASPFRLDGVEIQEVRWSKETEADTLFGLDIGLAPAPNDEWNKYKSFVKVLLYMAVGLPVVASPIGLAAWVIRDGENGFLARTHSEWVDKLLLLIRDPDLRQRMGLAARATVERDFALSSQLPRVLEIFRGLTAPR